MHNVLLIYKQWSNKTFCENTVFKHLLTSLLCLLNVFLRFSSLPKNRSSGPSCGRLAATWQHHNHPPPPPPRRPCLQGTETQPSCLPLSQSCDWSTSHTPRTTTWPSGVFLFKIIIFLFFSLLLVSYRRKACSNIPHVSSGSLLELTVQIIQALYRSFSLNLWVITDCV